MSRRATYAGLGEHWYLAYNATNPSKWRQSGRCASIAGSADDLHNAWKVFDGETVVLNGKKVKGSVLIELALGHCEICPVQWDCARYAVEAGEQFNTWAMPIDDLKQLQKMGAKAVEVIELARMENIAVQRAVAVVLRRKRT